MNKWLNICIEQPNLIQLIVSLVKPYKTDLYANHLDYYFPDVNEFPHLDNLFTVAKLPQTNQIASTLWHSMCCFLWKTPPTSVGKTNHKHFGFVPTLPSWDKETKKGQG